MPRVPLAIIALLALACGETETLTLDAGTPAPDADVARPDATAPDAEPEDATTPDTGADAGVMDAETEPCTTNPDCAGCAQEGECCFFSINCQPGSICNLPFEELYDPNAPAEVCVQVVCAGDDDCDPGEYCSPEGLCRDRPCQVDADCASGLRCLGGACEMAPAASAAASCAVVRQRVVLTAGVSAPIAAVVRDANGVPLPGLSVTWRASAPNVVSVTGDRVLGSTTAGEVELAAAVGAVACDGVIDVSNLEPLDRSAVRVTARYSDDGAPVRDGLVTMLTGAGQQALRTDARGTVTFRSVMPVDSVTVEADPAYATVLSPGTRDVLVVVPRPGWAEAGGVRGAVDIASTRRADLGMGFGGGAMRADGVQAGRWPLFGADPFETRIDVPELGVEQDAALPGGMLMSLGTRQLTADVQRCGAEILGPDELGCYLYTLPHGVRAHYTFAGQYRLSALTGVANELSQIISGGAIDAAFLARVAPLLRTLHHGVNPYLEVSRAPRVAVGNVDCTDPVLANYLDSCRPDYDNYQVAHLTSDQTQRILTVVDVPDLPALGATGCAPTMSLMLGADLGPRGIVPLGINAAEDTIDAAQTPDCVVEGADEPFGPNSAALSDGQIALSAAPRHDGLERAPLRLMAFATPASAPDSRAVLVQTYDRVPATVDLSAARFPSLPTASTDSRTGRVLTTYDRATDVLRVELYQGRRVWRVEAPAAATLQLPDIPRAQAVLQNSTAITVTSIQAPSYGETWDLGQETRFDANGTLEALASTRAR